MGESNGSGPTLEASVSFGKYEHDSLSWEKWSSFSPNKYLEEAEKCKTPGSVAQKKAYFEAHYKKIAAQKMEQEKKEQLEQEKKIELLDHCESRQISDIERSVTEGEVEKNVVDMEVNSLLALKDKEGPILATSDHEEVPDLEKQKSSERGSEDNLKEIPQVDNESKSSSAKSSKIPKQNQKNTTRKVHPTTEDIVSSGTKTKLASPVTKSSRISTPTSKPIPTSKVISSSQTSVKKVNGGSYQRSSNAPVAQSNKVLSRSLISPSQSSIKKLNGSTLQGSRNSPTIENKRIAPKSLHMSLSLGPPNSTASATRMRKSLIMEKMGDKDIVRRAFRSFQNSFNQGKPQVDTRYSGLKKVFPKGSDQNISASPTQVERASKDAGVERKKVHTFRPAGTRIE